jgi:hypothetical protein
MLGLARPNLLRAGDKIGPMKAQGRCFGLHCVRVVGLSPLGGSRAQRVVLMVDGMGQRFSWTAYRLKDSEDEPLHVRGEYIMEGGWVGLWAWV